MSYYYGGKREREMIDEGGVDILGALARKRWGIVNFVGKEKDA